MNIEKIKLNYDFSDLEGFIGSETMYYHYKKHYQKYINNTIELTKGTKYENCSIMDIVNLVDDMTIDNPIYKNAAQVLNHKMYFEQFTYEHMDIPLRLKGKINDKFGTFMNFVIEFEKECKNLFGSGYIWLVEDVKGDLSIMSTTNANNPITVACNPILCIDLWEHAYYLDYKNDRITYVENFWKFIDWNVINNRLR